MDNSVIDHLMEIKERLSSLETSTEDIKQGLKEHRVESQERIVTLEGDVNKAKGSVKALSWLVGILGGILVIIKAFAMIR
jgi:hypothetical protein